MKNPTFYMTVIAIAALGVSGCSSPTQSMEEPANTPAPVTTTATTATPLDNAVAGSSCPSASDVDTSNPDAVSRGFIRIAYCWDSVNDRTLTASSIRAKELMTDEMAQLQIEPERNAAQAMFNRAYEGRAYSEATMTVSPTELNSQDTEDKAVRVYLVDWDWKNEDGTTTTGGHALATVSMVKDGAAWKISAHSTDNFQEERS